MEIFCPACDHDDIDYVDEDWDACTNTETLEYDCLRCGCRFRAITQYEPVKTSFELVRKGH